jgi:hypothetical protein
MIIIGTKDIYWGKIKFIYNRRSVVLMPKIDLIAKEYEYYTVIDRNEERTK